MKFLLFSFFSLIISASALGQSNLLARNVNTENSNNPTNAVVKVTKISAQPNASEQRVVYTNMFRYTLNSQLRLLQVFYSQPNPASYQVSLHTWDGKVLDTKTVGPANYIQPIFSIDQLSKGDYFIQVKTEWSNSSRKFTIE